MEYPAAGGPFDAKRTMERQMSLHSQPPSVPAKWSRLAAAATIALMILGFWAAGGTLPGFQRPSLGTMMLEIGLPLVALGATFCSPDRCLVCAARGDGRLSLIGAWFFAGMAQFGAYHYITPVRRLPLIEFGLTIGAILFAAAVTSQLLAKARLFPLVIALPLSLGWGFGVVVQVNCLLDRSPTTVYRTLVSRKSPGLHAGQALYLEPWGPNPAPKDLLTSYSASVPRATFDAIRQGDTVCVVQRSSAMGMSWYTVQLCPSDGESVLVEPLGGL